MNMNYNKLLKIATEFDKLAQKQKLLKEFDAAKLLISYFRDALGGEGWDDPCLPLVIDDWWSFPSEGATSDWVLRQMYELIEDGFDPRYMINNNHDRDRYQRLLSDSEYMVARYRA
jgi:hypothetical protein